MFRWGISYHQVWGAKDKPPTDDKATIPLRCPICGIHTNSVIKGLWKTPRSEWVKVPTFEMEIYNYLLACTHCQSGLLLMWSYGEDHRSAQTAGRILYPYPTSAFETEKLPAGSIPAAIFEDLRQAELAYLVSAHYGAGLLLRRACQNICRDRQVPEKGGLKAQLKEMARMGIITSALGDMADSIRVVGNELAHPAPDKPFALTPDDIKIAREFLLQLVRSIYVDPAKVQKLKQDLDSRGIK